MEAEPISHQRSDISNRPSEISHPLTLAHVTHEAVEHLGGIGTVLEGLIASPVYQKHVGRTILVGPTQAHTDADPAQRLGEHGQVLYSSIDQIDTLGLGGRLRPVEWAFNAAIVYGKRRYAPPGQGRTGEAEVLLIDVSRIHSERINAFKHRLWERFGLDSSRYEASWDYEEYVRLAQPAFYALQVLLGEADLPCVMFGHEFMGLPACLQAILDGGDAFRTIFHAHECATARRIVEDHPGHDTMFYNVLRQAREETRFVEDVFGDLDQQLRHALIKRSHLCDGIIAVGDKTREELRFLGQAFEAHPIELVFNGLPAMPVTLKEKLASRGMLQAYAQRLVGYRPGVLLTHVTRPVISKGLWRDLRVCHELEPRLAARGEKAVLFILTSAGGVRRPEDVAMMEEQYGWPRHHREGYPDLVGPEVELAEMVSGFNARHEHVQVVLVNQFGWDQQRIGRRLPEGMDIADLRRAADVELGMATYEPFGISPLEPLGAGALCVISNVCGCRAFVEEATGGGGSKNVIVADFTALDRPHTVPELLAMTRHERHRIETRVAAEVAEALVERLPRTARQRERLIEAGQELVRKMGWDRVIERHLVPMLERVRRGRG